MEIVTYAKRNTVDTIALIGELEHTRRHALRSAVAAINEEDNDKAFEYQMFANKAQRLRRSLTEQTFPELGEKDWCLLKCAACLRQLSYESFTDHTGFLEEIDSLVDEILELATGEDLSGCAACKDDRETTSSHASSEKA